MAESNQNKSGFKLSKGDLSPRLFWLLIVLAVGGLLYLLNNILLPFILGGIIAYALNPLTNKFESWGLSRTLSTLAVLIPFFLLIAGAIVGIIPVIRNQFSDLIMEIPSYSHHIDAFIKDTLEHTGKFVPSDQKAVILQGSNQYLTNLVDWLKGILNQLINSSVLIVNLVSLVLITPIVIFYLLRDWSKIWDALAQWLPPLHAPVVIEQMHAIERVISGYARGQGLLCLLMAFFYATGLWLFRIDFGILIGIATGLFSFVPYLGTLAGFFICVMIAYTQFHSWTYITFIAIFFIIAQALEDGLLTPLIIGNRIKVHPLWIIFAILSGGTIFGFVGVLLATPIAGIIGVFSRFALKRYLSSYYYEH